MQDGHHLQPAYSGYVWPAQQYAPQDMVYAAMMTPTYDNQAYVQAYPAQVPSWYYATPQGAFQTPGPLAVHPPTPGPQRGSQTETYGSSRNEIRFYDWGQPYYEFTNFSPHPVTYDGKVYPTSEHLFQALKFENPADAERIRTQRSSRDALEMARQMSSRIQVGWVDQGLNIQAMEHVLLAKFMQYSELKRLLLSTGEAKLIEDSPSDAFWGVGADGRGRNELGKALMKVRSVLRAFMT